MFKLSGHWNCYLRECFYLPSGKSRHGIAGFIFFWLIFLLAGGVLIAQNLSAAPAYVQSSSAVPQTPQTTVTVNYGRCKAPGT